MPKSNKLTMTIRKISSNTTFDADQKLKNHISLKFEVDNLSEAYKILTPLYNQPCDVDFDPLQMSLGDKLGSK